MKVVDPAAMTKAERFAEIAEILAAGVQRFLAAEGKRLRDAENSANELDAGAGHEAACGSHALNPQSTTHA